MYSIVSELLVEELFAPLKKQDGFPLPLYKCTVEKPYLLDYYIIIIGFTITGLHSSKGIVSLTSIGSARSKQNNLPSLYLIKE